MGNLTEVNPFISNKKGFFATDNNLFDKWLKVIGKNAVIVYQMFCRLNKNDNLIDLKVSHKSLSAYVDMSEEMFSKNLSILNKFGLITVIRPTGVDRINHMTCKYIINPIPENIPSDIKGEK